MRALFGASAPPLSGSRSIAPPDIPNPTIPLLDRPFSIDNPLIIDRPFTEMISLVASPVAPPDGLHPSRHSAATVSATRSPRTERIIFNSLPAPEEHDWTGAIRRSEQVLDHRTTLAGARIHWAPCVPPGVVV